MNTWSHVTNMKVWAIRVKGTDKWLAYRRNGSYSYAEPEGGNIPPRFHVTKRGAQNALTNWLQGHYNFGWSGYQTTRLRYIKQPHRIKENMEIVEFALVEVK